MLSNWRIDASLTRVSTLARKVEQEPWCRSETARCHSKFRSIRQQHKRHDRQHSGSMLITR